MEPNHKDLYNYKADIITSQLYLIDYHGRVLPTLKIVPKNTCLVMMAPTNKLCTIKFDTMHNVLHRDFSYEWDLLDF